MHMKGMLVVAPVRVVASMTIAVVLALSVACSSSGRGRVSAGDDLFSVALPAGWHQAPPVGPFGSANSPDSGALRLVGPGNRSVQISWVDGPYENGFTVATFTHKVRSIPVTVGGQNTVLDEYELPHADRVPTHVGLMAGVSHRVDGHQVGFVADCQPADVADGDYAGCVAILSSWQWGSGAS